MYRITLFPDANTLCIELAVEAAFSNGRKEPFTIGYLKDIFERDCLKYPTTNSDMTFEVIGNNRVHVDRKVGDRYETVLILEQVELLDIPTLIPLGISDELNHELIN